MDTILSENISLSPVVSPYVASQIQDIIKEAIQPLQDEISDLKAIVAHMQEKERALEATQEQDVNRICLDIAYDRQRLAKLERIEPTASQEDQGKILRALLAARDGKMLTKEARKIMRMDKGNFSRLVASMPDYIETKTYSMDKKQRLLILKSRSIVVNNEQR
jgi:hypothetical protein